MRPIDTQALRDVAGLVGVGNPATAAEQVNFDDENLQQVLDVSTAVQGLGLGNGWATRVLTLTHAASGTLRGNADPYDFVELLGGDTRRVRCWLMGVGLSANEPGASSIDGLQTGFDFPAAPPHFLDAGELVVASTLTFSTTPLTTGGFVHSTSTLAPRGMDLNLPVVIHPGGLLRLASIGTIDGANLPSGRATWILWYGPRGARPPRAR